MHTLTALDVSKLPDDQWINDAEIIVTVLKIEPINKKAGGVFYKATLGNGPGDYTNSFTLSLFIAPKFQVGDVIRIAGKGLKKGSYQGKPQVGLGKESTIDIQGKSTVAVAATVQQAQHAQQSQTIATDMVAGQTVGMAMKEALAIHTIGMSHQEATEAVTAPGFWSAVYMTASDVIRVARMLESGKLADPVSVRKGVPSAAKHVAPPLPQHDPESELDSGEPVPF